MRNRDPAKRRVWDRTWKECNRDKVNALARASYHRDPEKHRAAARARRLRDPIKARETRNRCEHKRRGMPAPTRPKPDTCECCGGPPGKKALHLDHCHTTGKFRGWLCGKCNTAIGKLGDTKTGVMRALKYLERAI